MFETKRISKGISLGAGGMMLIACFALFIISTSEIGTAYVTRPTSIYIWNDSQFTPENGVSDGTGTESDPFVIEGWSIYASTGSCIEIVNTQAHFVIRNCSLRGSGSIGPNLIEFSYVRNGTVEDVIGSEMGAGSGVSARYSSNITIVGNSFSENARGVYLDECHNITLTASNLTDNRDGGFLLTSSHDIWVHGNNISDNIGPGGDAEGIFMTECHDIVVAGNNLTGNGGIGLWENSCRGVEISDNFFAYNGRYTAGLPSTCNSSGIYIHESIDTILSRNNLTADGVDIHYTTKQEYATIQLDTTNRVNGHPVRFFKDSAGVSCEDMPTGQLIVINCTDVRISGIGTEPSGVEVAIQEATSVEVSNCIIHGHDYIGLELWRVSNIEISECRLSSDIYGLRASEFTNLTIHGCEVGGDKGIYLTMGSVAEVSNNVICEQFIDDSDGPSLGLYLDSISHSVVSQNNLSGWLGGGNCEDCEDLTIIGNEIHDNFHGLRLGTCSQILVVNNNFTLNDFGLFLDYCSSASLYQNNFWYSACVQAMAPTDDDDSWNESYPIGGNYWSDYAGTDEMRGPSQDIPGADGIGDTPYSISSLSETQDHYPLMRPANVPNAAPVAFFTVNPLVGDASTEFLLNASGLWDREDSVDVVEVRWDFDGDGEWDTDWNTDKSAYHQYMVPGTYTVRLEARDSGGLTNTTSAEIIVVEAIPEFSDVTIPMLLMLLIMVFSAWRRRVRE